MARLTTLTVELNSEIRRGWDGRNHRGSRQVGKKLGAVGGYVIAVYSANLHRNRGKHNTFGRFCLVTRTICTPSPEENHYVRLIMSQILELSKTNSLEKVTHQDNISCLLMMQNLFAPSQQTTLWNQVMKVYQVVKSAGNVQLKQFVQSGHPTEFDWSSGLNFCSSVDSTNKCWIVVIHNYTYKLAKINPELKQGWW